jgi:hypothetical protein
MSNYLKYTIDYIAAGLSVMPVLMGKEPAVSTWKPLQTAPLSLNEFKDLMEGRAIGVIKPTGIPKGIALITGQVAGGLEVLDIQTKHDKSGSLWPELSHTLKSTIPDLWEKLIIVETPSGGRHLYYRCQVITGNAILAAKSEKMGTANDNPKVLIETHGECGYVLAPPTKGYKIVRGSFQSIPTITPIVRATLFSIARSFDQMQKPLPLTKAEKVISVNIDQVITVNIINRTSTDRSLRIELDRLERYRKVVGDILVTSTGDSLKTLSAVEKVKPLNRKVYIIEHGKVYELWEYILKIISEQYPGIFMSFLRNLMTNHLSSNGIYILNLISEQCPGIFMSFLWNLLTKREPVLPMSIVAKTWNHQKGRRKVVQANRLPEQVLAKSQELARRYKVITVHLVSMKDISKITVVNLQWLERYRNILGNILITSAGDSLKTLGEAERVKPLNRKIYIRENGKVYELWEYIIIAFVEMCPCMSMNILRTVISMLATSRSIEKQQAALSRLVKTAGKLVNEGKVGEAIDMLSEGLYEAKMMTYKSELEAN